MKSSRLDILKNEANEMFNVAEKEIRGDQMIDTYKACMNCKHSMINYLNSYLESQGVKPSELQTISVLLEQCRSINDQFSDLDLSSINCRYEIPNDDHCIESSDLEKCLDTTSAVKDIVEKTV